MDKIRSEMPNVPDELIYDIEQVGVNAAWHTANLKSFGFVDVLMPIKGIDAIKDEHNFNQAANRVKESPYISDELADNIKWCAWNMSWYWANRKFGDEEAAKEDAKKVA